jgi:transcription initiation factor TFIIE subunit alpha
MQLAEPEELILEEFIKRVAGEEGLIIFHNALSREFTDEEISIKTGLDLNSARRALFALYESGLAEYRREKDEDSGWLTYYWKIIPEKGKAVLKRELEKAKRNFKLKIEFESSNMFYYCKNGCGKILFEDAMSFNFVCPNCGSSLDFVDNTKLLEFLEEEIQKIDNMLKSLM